MFSKQILALVFLAALLLVEGCATAIGKREPLVKTTCANTKAEQKVVVIGGWGASSEQMKLLGGIYPDVVVIVPQKRLPLGEATTSLHEQLKEKNICGSIVLVAYSWGGLLARGLSGSYPEWDIKKIILIGTPNGGYKLAPQWLFSVTSTERSRNIPMFVVAGDRGAKKWYLDDPNDGTVELSWKSVV